MWPILVVVGQVFIAHVRHVPLAKDDEAVEALLLNCLHEPLDESVRVGTANRGKLSAWSQTVAIADR
jgi:hypothetical protein